MAAYTQGKPLSGIRVASAMSKRLFTVNRLESVSTAEGIMRRFCIRRLPVVDNTGELVGILTLDDITKHGQLGPVLGKDPLSEQAIAGTAAALGHPSSPKE
jgi:CBS domain-containing protein